MNLSKWTPQRRAELLKLLDEKRGDKDLKELIAASAELSGFPPSVLAMHEMEDHLERFGILLAMALMSIGELK